MNRFVKRLGSVAFSAGVLFAGVSAPPAAEAATSILVGQCVEFSTCWTSPTPTTWSYHLDSAQLADLGLGATTPFIAAQTSQSNIRLGDVRIAFTTTGLSVVELIGDFNGPAEADPCNFCYVATVATVSIPSSAISATISGTFGNSVVPSSAGVNLYLGSLPAVPEPATWAMVILGVAAIGFAARRRNTGMALAA